MPVRSGIALNSASGSVASGPACWQVRSRPGSLRRLGNQTAANYLAPPVQGTVFASSRSHERHAAPSGFRQSFPSAVHKGASRRRAAPRSQPGTASRWLNCQRALQHRQDNSATKPCAGSLTSRITLARAFGQCREVLLWPSSTCRKPRPNMSVNRRRYGKAPWPRGVQCISCASRPGRLASTPRLPLR